MKPEPNTPLKALRRSASSSRGGEHRPAAPGTRKVFGTLCEGIQTILAETPKPGAPLTMRSKRVSPHLRSLVRS